MITHYRYPFLDSMTRTFTNVFMPENFDPITDRVAGYSEYHFLSKAEVLQDLRDTVKKVFFCWILILEVL